MSDSEDVDYIAINRVKWDERAPIHAKSKMYDLDRLLKSEKELSKVVAFDVPLLPDLKGLDIVHLQCHIGTDTLSIARLGAASVTGLDFSQSSVDVAEDLATKAKGIGGEKLRYVQSTVEDSLSVLTPGSFDMVYTGIGALCWLPSMAEWAKIVAALLRPGGRLFVRDHHPMIATIEQEIKDKLVVEYPYFERPKPQVWVETGTYADAGDDVEFKADKTAEFFHSIGEIMTGLLDAGMHITGYVEQDSLPWDALPGQMTKLDNGEWQLKDRPWRLPHAFTLQAIKK